MNILYDRHFGLVFAGKVHKNGDTIVLPERRCWLSTCGKTVIHKYMDKEYSFPTLDWNKDYLYPTLIDERRQHQVILGHVNGSDLLKVYPAAEYLLMQSFGKYLYLNDDGFMIPVPENRYLNLNDLSEHTIHIDEDVYKVLCPFCGNLHTIANNPAKYVDLFSPTILEPSKYDDCEITIVKGKAYKIVNGKIQCLDLKKINVEKKI